MIDLKDIAKSLLADCIDGDRLDLRKLREGIYERSFDAADSACIYTHACADIIAHYESDPRADGDEADHIGESYKPSQYREAMQCYAHFIARSIIEAEACELIEELELASEHLTTVLAALSPLVPVAGIEDAFRLSRDCPHGWASHNREDEAGACYWLSRQLDGCNAVAVPAAGVWLSYTWDPARIAA